MNKKITVNLKEVEDFINDEFLDVVEEFVQETGLLNGVDMDEVILDMSEDEDSNVSLSTFVEEYSKVLIEKILNLVESFGDTK